jgi:hypothetical protein
MFTPATGFTRCVFNAVGNLGFVIIHLLAKVFLAMTGGPLAASWPMKIRN